MTPLATVQLHAEQSLRVDAKTELSVGVARLVVEHETLRPFFGFRRGGGAVAVVVVEVEVFQAQVGFAVTEEVRVCLGG
ncbi:hypothetical protein D9M71_329190 [compost metagenome]